MNPVLEAKVKAVNAANKYGHELYNSLVPIFKPLIGCKIEKQDGQLLKSIQKQLPEFPYNNKLSVYKITSNYSLAYCVKTCVMIDGMEFCVYHEAVVCIGNMREGVLLEILSPFKEKTDYSAEEIQSLRENYTQAK